MRAHHYNIPDLPAIRSVTRTTRYGIFASMFIVVSEMSVLYVSRVIQYLDVNKKSLRT